MHEGRGCRRTPPPDCAPNRSVAAHRIIPGQNLGAVCSHGALLTENVGVSPRLDAGARSYPSVPRAVSIVFNVRSRFVPPTRYEGRAVMSGSEAGTTDLVRTTASEVSGRAFSLHSTRGRVSAVSGSRRSEACRTPDQAPKPPK